MRKTGTRLKDQSYPLLDFCFLLQILLKRLQLSLLQRFRYLRFDFFEFGYLCIAYFVKLDDVITELSLYRYLRKFARFESYHSVGKWLDERVCRRPSKVTAVLRRDRVF